MTTEQSYDGTLSSSRTELLGETWAVSEKTAIRNIKYRLGLSDADLYCDGTYDYERKNTLKAIEIF